MKGATAGFQIYPLYTHLYTHVHSSMCVCGPVVQEQNLWQHQRADRVIWQPGCNLSVLFVLMFHNINTCKNTGSVPEHYFFECCYILDLESVRGKSLLEHNEQRALRHGMKCMFLFLNSWSLEAMEYTNGSFLMPFFPSFCVTFCLTACHLEFERKIAKKSYHQWIGLWALLLEKVWEKLSGKKPAKA